CQNLPGTAGRMGRKENAVMFHFPSVCLTTKSVGETPVPAPAPEDNSSSSSGDSCNLRRLWIGRAGSVPTALGKSFHPQ
ncbi:MAG: hypothetical protein NTU74_04210, partial [Deltaproteobacteria bacterium]|nr:hypothetical protein [Deltaproteobacteria bacterium]